MYRRRIQLKRLANRRRAQHRLNAYKRHLNYILYDDTITYSWSTQYHKSPT